MGKMFWGVLLGAAAATAFYKLNEQGKFDGLYDEANKFMARGKRRAKEAWEYTQDEAEYLAERARKKAEHLEQVAKEKANVLADKIEETGECVANKIREKAQLADV